MWIITHQGSTTPLKPNHKYTLGRDVDCDFIVNSSLVSRNHLEIVTGKVNVTDLERTRLEIRVLSRARSVIDGSVYKLSKGDLDPIQLDLTEQNTINMSFRLNADEEIATTLLWKEFTIFTTETAPVLKLSKSIDLRISESPQSATHCYTTQESGMTINLALLNAIPALGKKWIQFIENEPENVEGWFLDIDYNKVLPKDFQFLIPDNKRPILLNGITVASFENSHISEWINSLSGKFVHFNKETYISDGLNEPKLLNDLKKEGQKVLLWGTKDSSVDSILAQFAQQSGSKLISEPDLFEAVKNCSLSNLPLLNLKRELEETQTSARKRRKYQKVDKMHFFDFSTPPTQDQPSEDSEVQVTGSIIPTEQSESSKKPEIEEIISEPKKDSITVSPNPSDPIDELINENKDSSSSNTLHSLLEEEPVVTDRSKRKIEQQSSTRPTKIPKFIPKVSLADAIISTKENATKGTNDELGLNEIDEFDANLRNLAIVEEVEFKLRAPPVHNPIEQYQDRKNFKNFRKNLKVTNVTRTFVELSTVTINNDIKFMDSKAVHNSVNDEDKLSKDFNGLMNDVKGYQVEKEGLFVDDNSDEEQFSFQPSKARQKETPTYAIEDEDDDDDDDDDQPKFGFSRK